MLVALIITANNIIYKYAETQNGDTLSLQLCGKAKLFPGGYLITLFNRKIWRPPPPLLYGSDFVFYETVLVKNDFLHGNEHNRDKSGV